MGRMGELESAVATQNRQLRSIHGRSIATPAVTPISLEDVQREHSELLAWLTDYHHAASQGVGRIHLLAIFDATLACARKHFRSVEALFEQSAWSRPQRHHDIQCAWSRLQRHHELHCRITEELEACRMRLAGNDPLDAADCAHVVDVMLMQFARDQPLLFNQRGARFKRAQRDESGDIEATGLRRQPWKT